MTDRVPYLLLLGITIEAIIFLMALLIKYNQMIRELSLQEAQLVEINHRVKNNLSIILTFIGNDTRRCTSQKAKEKFLRLQNRIFAMADVYKLLFFKKGKIHADIDSYIHTLYEKLKTSLAPTANVKMEANVDVETLEMKTMETVGQILNELITNFFKYNNEPEKFIKISLRMDGEHYLLDVEDNSKGFKPPQNNKTSGIEIVNRLVESNLGGTVRMYTDGKVRYIIRWK